MITWRQPHITLYQRKENGMKIVLVRSPKFLAPILKKLFGIK
ncbi:MAG: stage V sporulation protein SpoVM [Clostridia bacterium]|nr:stage V sporulation protein SpoVM [Clostridia bacterium]